MPFLKENYQGEAIKIRISEKNNDVMKKEIFFSVTFVKLLYLLSK
ncbi:hypothetical protein SRABI04_00390 [Chryseobacterium sp. Bi04]|nr:hypothetical protein SRABI04_00390 [Chryseobacterium sp. Bi04]